MTDNVTCLYCQDSFDEADDYLVNGEHTCPDCAAFCESCEDTFLREEAEDVLISWQGNQETWCPDCVERYASQCYNCDDYAKSNEQSHHVYIEGMGWQWLCSPCLESGEYPFCENEYCETIVNDYGSRCEECGYDDAGELHYYSYQPELEFLGDGPYFGVELEVEVSNMGEAIGSVSSLIQYTPRGQPAIYLKEDCSIDYGFELVSHPASYEAWRTGEVVQWRGFQNAVGVQRNHSSVGMHIHVGRDAFDSPAHLWKFGLFHYRNSRIIQAFAGRSYSSYCEWVEDDQRAQLKRRLKDYGGDRYSPLNFNNDATIELRYFQADERKSRMLGRIGFVDALLKYTRHLDAGKYKDNGMSMVRFLNWLIAQPDAERYAYTIEQLAEVTTPESLQVQRERNRYTYRGVAQAREREREQKERRRQERAEAREQLDSMEDMPVFTTDGERRSWFAAILEWNENQVGCNCTSCRTIYMEERQHHYLREGIPWPLMNRAEALVEVYNERNR